MDWKQVGEQIGKFAPVLGGVLGGPGGAALGGIVASALGVGNNAGEVSAAITGNTDAMVKLRELETQQRVRLDEIAANQVTELARAEVADRDSARRMQTATQSRMPAVLASVFTVGYFAVMVLLFWRGVPKDGTEVVLLLVGSLTAAEATILAFYFGTTFASNVKTDMLARKG